MQNRYEDVSEHVPTNSSVGKVTIQKKPVTSLAGSVRDSNMELVSYLNYWLSEKACKNFVIPGKLTRYAEVALC